MFFALNGHDRPSRQVARVGGFEITRHEESVFDGGEHKARPLVDVRKREDFGLHSLNGDPHASANDNILRVLFYLATCHDHGTARAAAIKRLHHSLDGRQ